MPFLCCCVRIKKNDRPEGRFVDGQTQTVLNRNFPVPDYSVNDAPDKLEIITEYLVVTYDKKPFSGNGLQVQVLGNKYLRKTGIWFYRDSEFLESQSVFFYH